MILGIGTDLCDIRRIEAALQRHGDRFVERICTERERRRAERRNKMANAVAQMFAAKEACAKALGTGFRQNVFWRNIELSRRATGKPYLILHDGALARLNLLTPPGMTSLIDISLTDEFPMAHAMVILSAESPEISALRRDDL